MGYFDSTDLKQIAAQPRPPAQVMAPPPPIPFSDKGTFTEPKGLFSVPKGLFMPDGSVQQEKAIAKAKRLGVPSVEDVDQTPAPMEMGGMPPPQSRRRPLQRQSAVDTPTTSRLALGMPSVGSSSLLDDEA